MKMGLAAYGLVLALINTDKLAIPDDLTDNGFTVQPESSPATENDDRG